MKILISVCILDVLDAAKRIILLNYLNERKPTISSLLRILMR